MKDKYKEEKIKAFKECKDDEEIGDLINKIYEDGFEDGTNDEKSENDGIIKLRFEKTTGSEKDYKKFKELWGNLKIKVIPVKEFEINLDFGED
jgi:hypothetical protein